MHHSRAKAALLGLAIGDAVGTTLEFKAPGTFSPITDMTGGGPFDLKPGQWTDDTSMALCLAESLIACGRFDAEDQMRRYVRWYREGHFSATGRCFDIGGATRAALEKYERTKEPFAGSADPHSAGNGSLMRLAPVAMAYASRPETAIEYAAESSRTTHGTRECVDACRYFAGVLVGLINGAGKDEVLANGYSPVPGLWESKPLAPKIAAIAGGSFLSKRPPAIQGTGYVVDCLEAALWAFATTRDFESAILAAANLGHDADTTAAVCGQVAGAFYAMEGLPEKWLAKLALRDVVEGLADATSALSDPAK